jgi:predicted lipoprotein
MACLALSSCVPWTVRPIDEVDGHAGPFDAGKYVDSIWASKVLPAAGDAPDLSAARCVHPCLVKGQGRVVRVETTSRSGLAYLDSGAVLQIGPVIRGTALRDALPFIQFSQFTNQLEFARVGNALNDRASKVLAGIDPPHLEGAEIAFCGAMEPGSPGEIVPVRLEVRRGNS